MINGTQNTNTMKTSDYRIEEFNKGTLFAVVSDYHLHSRYYKTRKGAEKMLKKVQYWAGETIESQKLQVVK